jgi:DNA-binding response OmpR family regulator
MITLLLRKENKEGCMKVVHLDNSEFFRRLMRIFLLKKDVECISCEEANDALEAIKTNNDVIVVAGTYFAGMDLVDFIKEIRALPRAIPIIILTAGTTSEDQQDLIGKLDVDVDAYVEKTGAWETAMSFYLNKLIEKLM